MPPPRVCDLTHYYTVRYIMSGTVLLLGRERERGDKKERKGLPHRQI